MNTENDTKTEQAASSAVETIVMRKFLVTKPFNGYKKGSIIKECRATDGSNRIYYTTGNGDISFGNVENHMNNLQEI